MNQKKKTAEIPKYPFAFTLRWNILTPLYDYVLFCSGLGKHFDRKIAREAQILPHEKDIVDVGCGSGTLLEVLRQEYSHIHLQGIDPDARVLGLARKKLMHTSPPIELAQAFAETLPLANNSVDVCFSMLMLHHVPSEVKPLVLKEMYRILKPGGRLILVDWGVLSLRLTRWLLFFERQAYLDAHFDGLVPTYLKDAGFLCKEADKVKMMGIYRWVCQKPHA